MTNPTLTVETVQANAIWLWIIITCPKLSVKHYRLDEINYIDVIKPRNAADFLKTL